MKTNRHFFIFCACASMLSISAFDSAKAAQSKLNLKNTKMDRTPAQEDEEAPPAESPQPPRAKAVPRPKGQPVELDEVTSYTDTLDGSGDDAEQVSSKDEGSEEELFINSVENDLDSEQPSKKQKFRPRVEKQPEDGRKRSIPYRITKKGEFLYKVPRSPQKQAFNFKVGGFNPLKLRNPSTGKIFSELYPTAPPVILVFDYEWQLLQGFGKLGIKAGSGFHMASGQGVFKNNGNAVLNDFRPNGGNRSEETYLLFTLPHSAGAIYRAQYYDQQPIVPYVEGGLSYYTMLETRDDNVSPKFQGAGAAYTAVGLAIQLDWMNRESMYRLDADYGINHLYLTGEYRIVAGFDADYDFSDNTIAGGLTIEF
jgi:hypothetical protein